jgi:hypothetical protein
MPQTLLVSAAEETVGRLTVLSLSKETAIAAKSMPTWIRKTMQNLIADRHGLEGKVLENQAKREEQDRLTRVNAEAKQREDEWAARKKADRQWFEANRSEISKQVKNIGGGSRPAFDVRKAPVAGNGSPTPTADAPAGSTAPRQRVDGGGVPPKDVPG